MFYSLIQQLFNIPFCGTPANIEIINASIRILKVLIVAISTLWILTEIGVDSKQLFTSLGIGTLAIALALRETIANFFSGLKLIWDDKFSPGDWIAVKGEKEGTVIDITFMNTIIRGFDNSLVIIPNSIIASTSYINWSRRKIGRKIELNIGVTYQSNMRDIENAIKEIYTFLEKCNLISPPSANFDKTIFRYGRFVKVGNDKGLKNTLMVHLSEFGDFSVNAKLNYWPILRTIFWKKNCIALDRTQKKQYGCCRISRPAKSPIYISEPNERLLGSDVSIFTRP